MEQSNHSLKLDRGIIEYIKQVVDPELIASSLGISGDRRYGNTIRTTCPFHASENKTTFSLNLDTGNWSCFSNGCHHGYSDIIGLVQLSKGINFVESIKYIAALAGIDLTSDYTEQAESALRRKDVTDFIRRVKKSKVEMDLCTISNIEEEIFKWVQNRTSYFYDRGYRYDIQDYFEIGANVDRYGVPRACFPIRDENGKVVAWDGRRLDGDEEPRYFVQPEGFVKGKVFYHYHKAKHYVRVFDGILFVVEGYKACWSMFQAGYINTVACMGAGFQGDQKNILLRDLHIREVVLCLDGDIAGKNGTARAQRELGHLLNLSVVEMPDEQDPSTLDLKTLHTLILNRKGVNHGNAT